MFNRLFKKTFKKAIYPKPVPRIPTFPTLNECCQKNCKECVWVSYFSQLAEYRRTHFSYYKQN